LKPGLCIQVIATRYPVPKMGNAANHYHPHTHPLSDMLTKWRKISESPDTLLQLPAGY